MKFLSKIIEYGLYLLVFLLPAQTRWILKPGILNGGPWEYGTYSLYATDMLLLVIIILFIIYNYLGRRITNHESRIKNSDQDAKSKIQYFLILGLVLFSAAATLFADDKLLALFKFSWLLLGVGLYALVASAKYQKIKLVWSLLAGLALQACLAVWQFFWQTTWSNKWLGLALHRAGDLGTSVVETLASDGVAERWLRAYGGQDHPNILGGLVAIGMLFLIGELIRADRSTNEFSIFNFQFLEKLQIKSKTNRINPIKTISWFLLALFAAALFFSFSRSAWLGLGVGLVVISIGTLISKNLPAQKKLLQAVLIVSLVWFVLFINYPHLALTRLYAGQNAAGSSISRLESKSLSERREGISQALTLIKRHWFNGVGPGNYTLALRQELKSGEQSYYYQPVHNTFILIWSEIGFFGWLFFLGLMISSTIFNWKSEVGGGGRAKDGLINLAILMVLFMIMFFDHWLWSLHFGVILFWLVLGLVNRTENNL